MPSSGRGHDSSFIFRCEWHYWRPLTLCFVKLMKTYSLLNTRFSYIPQCLMSWPLEICESLHSMNPLVFGKLMKLKPSEIKGQYRVFCIDSFPIRICKHFWNTICLQIWWQSRKINVSESQIPKGVTLANIYGLFDTGLVFASHIQYMYIYKTWNDLFLPLITQGINPLLYGL